MTASDPLGTTPPVAIAIACPAASARLAGRPAAIRSTTGRRPGESADRSAYPSIAELANDDGSTDGSFAALTRLHAREPNVRVVRLRRNFGKATALAAGFEQASGEVVVTIDADLQDDPAEIPRLLAKLEEGFDLVSGWKAH